MANPWNLWKFSLYGICRYKLYTNRVLWLRGCCRPGSGESGGGITREQWTVQLGYQIVTGTKEVEWSRVRNLRAGTKMKIDGTEEPVTGAHKNHWQDSDICYNNNHEWATEIWGTLSGGWSLRHTVYGRDTRRCTSKQLPSKLECSL